MGSHPLFIERRRNPQISSRPGLETALIRLLVDRPVDRSKYLVDRRSIAQTAGHQMGSSFLCNIGQLLGQSISLLVHVGWPHGRPNLCHRVKKTLSTFAFALFLHLVVGNIWVGWPELGNWECLGCMAKHRMYASLRRPIILCKVWSIAWYQYLCMILILRICFDATEMIPLLPRQLRWKCRSMGNIGDWMPKT